MSEKIAVLGAGAWGTALALRLAAGGAQVALWMRDPAAAGTMAAERQNRKEHDALSRIFGPRFAAYYLDEFLFAPPEHFSQAAAAPGGEAGSDVG